jgi:hypothetical protein
MQVNLLNHESVNLKETLDNMHSDEFYYNHLNLDKALSYSSVKWLLKSPKWFAHMKKKGMTESQALRDGKLVHTQILEPRKYDQFTFVDTSSKNTTKWKLAKEQNGADLTYTLKEKYMCNRISTAWLQNDSCVRFLQDSETEVPALVEINGLAIRGKADIYRAGEFVADVKTTNDGLQDFEQKDGSLKNQFSWTISKYDYDLQAYLYTVLFNVPDFYWLVIDKTTTDIGIFKASDETLESGRLKLEASLALYNAFFVDELIDLSQYHKEGVL